MTGYKYLITIANRKFAEEYLEFFKDYKFADGAPFGSLEEDYSTEHLKRE